MKGMVKIMTKSRRPKHKTGLLKVGIAVSSMMATLMGTNWVAQLDNATAVAAVPEQVLLAPTPVLLPIPTIVAPTGSRVQPVVPVAGAENGRFAAIPTIIAPKLNKLDVGNGGGPSLSLDLPPIPSFQVPSITVARSRSSR
jgi:hypothetical protein